MLTLKQAKQMTKSELINLILSEARVNPPFVRKSGKPYVPDRYKERIAKMTYAELTEEYNALCLENYGD